MGKLSIEQVDLAGRRVFLRADLNVPLEGGAVADDTRLTAVVPTIEHALKAGAIVVLASHLGRPKGKPDPEYSLRPVATRLEALLGRSVPLAPDCVGEETAALARTRGAGDLLLLENLRFHKEEEANDDAFARALAALADCYVNDAFAAAHRAHASIEAITRHLQPAAAGLLMRRELETLTRILDRPERPLVAVLGGAKVSDKLALVEHLLERVDGLLIGGGMAFTFLRALGHEVGRSLVEAERVETARRVLESARRRGVPLILRTARTIVWNGPMGVFEKLPFAAGTLALARAAADSPAFSVIGGGDTVSAITRTGVADRIGYISTAGGAFLEFLEGRKLPGVEALTEAA